MTTGYQPFLCPVVVGGGRDEWGYGGRAPCLGAARCGLLLVAGGVAGAGEGQLLMPCSL
jgi:hypothetical protein